MSSSPDGVTAPPVTINPPRHRQADGGVSVDAARHLTHARTRFANRIADAESEAAAWMAAYEELEAQRQDEVVSLTVRLQQVEAEHSAALQEIIDLKLALEGIAPDPVVPEPGEAPDPVAATG